MKVSLLIILKKHVFCFKINIIHIILDNELRFRFNKLYISIMQAQGGLYALIRLYIGIQYTFIRDLIHFQYTLNMESI